jgi:hypothetical protein
MRSPAPARPIISLAPGDLRDYAGACAGDEAIARQGRAGGARLTIAFAARFRGDADAQSSPSSTPTHRSSRRGQCRRSTSVASTSSSASEIRARAQRSPPRAARQRPVPTYSS